MKNPVVKKPLSPRPSQEWATTVHDQTWEKSGWEYYLKHKNPNDRLYFTTFTPDQFGLVQPGLALRTHLGNIYKFQKPSDHTTFWSGWTYYRYLKLIWLARDYHSAGYHFNFPFSALRIANNNLHAYAGRDRLTIMKMFGIPISVPTFYYDIDGKHPPKNGRLIDDDLETLLVQHIPWHARVNVSLYEFQDRLVPCFEFDTFAVERAYQYTQTVDVLTYHREFPVVINSARRWEILDSLRRDRWLRKTYRYTKQMLEDRSPEFREVDPGETPYWIEIHRPIRAGHSWLEALLWLIPDHNRCEGEAFTLHIRNAPERTYRLPPIY